MGGTINGRQVRGTIAQGGSGWASVYVGIDVHRKRSQMAVVAEDGKVQLNRNVVNGTEPILKLIGGLPGGRRWRLSLPSGGAGWYNYSRTTASIR